MNFVAPLQNLFEEMQIDPPPLVELDIKNTSLADMIYLLQNLYYT